MQDYGAPMPIEWLYLGVGFLVVVLFCKALEIIVDRATSQFFGKNDVLNLNVLRMELNAVNKEIDGLRIIHEGKLDALEIEVNTLNSKLESMPAKWLSLVPTSPMQKDTGGKSEDTWTRDETSIAPTIAASTSNDTWTRGVGDKTLAEPPLPIPLGEPPSTG
jgi:hypothetical protein